MISRIILKNFLSYAYGEAEFRGATIAVVGENGAGKSAFLEAIPYVYFGLGRESLAGMSRINGDGSHEVQVWDGGYVFVRGRKTSGKGYVEVRSGATVVSKGEEAAGWISEYLGMDSDTYMLTAFFGLHDVRHDSLIRVVPSVRLETLQRIAQIGPYKTFQAKAKDGYDYSIKKYDTEKARKSGAEEALDDVSELESRIDACQLDIGRLKTERDSASVQLRDLKTNEDKYIALIRERDKVGVEVDAVVKDARRLDNDIESFTSEIDDATVSMQEVIESRKSVVNSLSGYDTAELSAELEALNVSTGELKTLRSLKTVASTMSDSTECPLCGAVISEGMITSWATDVISLGASIDQKTIRIVEVQKGIREFKRLDDTRATLTQDIKNFVDFVKGLESKLANSKSMKVNKDREVLALTKTYNALDSRLKSEFSGLKESIGSVDELISDLSGKIGVASGTLKQLRERVARHADAQKAIRGFDIVMGEAKKYAEAYDLLRTAWGRYGIPLQLIRDISLEIESRATAVYQEFDNGLIEVSEVEDRGRPGIEFFLSDVKGKRTFNQLSAGEKVMFFIAVRVAISQIVAERSKVSVDYLILDEAMGNLSVKRRDDLIRIVNKVLRKVFPQVIMVSHTEMRDIFSQTVRISSVNGSSVVEVA